MRLMRRKIAVLLLAALLLCGCAESVPEMTTEPDVSWQPTTTAAATEPVTEETETTEAATEAETTEAGPAEVHTVPPELPDTEFARITAYIPTALERLAYATEENFTGVKIYDFTEAYLRYGTLKKLMRAGERLAEYGYGIVIWDAYRPVYGQERLWEAYPNAAYVSPPGTGTQSHCRGSAVDITLYDLQTGVLLEMPTGFDDFSASADRDYRDVSEEAAANAALLERIMAECGFKPYSAEWWHFTDTDSYDIEYVFDPGDAQ